MAQLPNVKLEIDPIMFDVMMGVLAHNATSEDDQLRNGARDLMEKRMRFTRLYPGEKGEEYASIRMYEREAAEMIWQLLYACVGSYSSEKEYSKELKHGGVGHD